MCPPPLCRSLILRRHDGRKVKVIPSDPSVLRKLRSGQQVSATGEYDTSPGNGNAFGRFKADVVIGGSHPPVPERECSHEGKKRPSGAALVAAARRRRGCGRSASACLPGPAGQQAAPSTVHKPQPHPASPWPRQQRGAGGAWLRPPHRADLCRCCRRPPPPPTAAIVAPWVEPEVWPTLDAAELMPGMNGRRLLQTVNLTPGVPFNTFNPVALQNIKVLFIPSEAPSPQCRPVQAGLTRLIVRLP